jgi:MFS family permease
MSLGEQSDSYAANHFLNGGVEVKDPSTRPKSKLFTPTSVLPDVQEDEPAMDDLDSKSTRKSKHISLQSRVESIAAESLRMGRDSIPPVYQSRGPSMSFLLEPTDPRSNEPVDEDEKLGPRASTRASSRLSQTSIEMSLFHEILFVGIVAVSHLCTQAALGQALAPIDIIASNFGKLSPGEISWFIAGYSLTVGTFILISGRLGDILGHKRVFAFGYAWLGVWSCFAGFSVYPKKQIFFDVCRAMQGIGPALLMPNGLALFGRAYPPGLRKNIVFSVFGALAPAGFVIGATFGSLFSQLVWWPWAFWSFGLACFGLAVSAVLIIPKALSHKPKDPPGFDFSGCVVGVAGLVLINVAWNNGPLYGWSTPHVYFVLIIGVLCIIAFLWVERRTLHPILPVHAMNGTVGFVLALVGLGWGAFGVWVFYTFRFLEIIRHSSPLSASAQFAPAVICGLLAAGLTGFLLTHTPVSFVMLVSMLAFFTGITIAAFQPVNQVYWAQQFVSIVIMPFGMDMSFPAATVILSNFMPRDHQGLAASLVNTFVNYGISIALGIAGTVEMTVTEGAVDGPEFLKGVRASMYTSMGLAGFGVVLGAMFFAKSMMRDGWKVMDH